MSTFEMSKKYLSLYDQLIAEAENEIEGTPGDSEWLPGLPAWQATRLAVVRQMHDQGMIQIDPAVLIEQISITASSLSSAVAVY